MTTTPAVTAPDRARRRLALLGTALLALALAGALYLAERRIDWNPADEGYLWYGTVATAHGAVPLRDFRSYDPARYLWGAAWAKLLGDGVLALRFSTALFGAAGLFCGLRAARRGVRSTWALAAVGVVLVLWMSPRHKMFESAIEMALALAAVRLVEEPSTRRHLALGATVGFAAFVGKNHGLYGIVASLGLIVYLMWRGGEGRSGEGPRIEIPCHPDEAGAVPGTDPLKRAIGPRDGEPPAPWTARLGAWLGGVALGASPFAAMCLVPGFLGAFWKSCLFYVVHGRTNVPVPVRWPWDSYAGLSGWELAERTAAGACYVLWPALCLGVLVLALATRRERLAERRLAIGSGFVACLYLHHVFARADNFHLTQGSHPMLLAALGLPLALPPGRRRWGRAAVAAVLLLLTAGIAVPQSEIYDRVTSRPAAGGDPAERLVPFAIGGDRLLLHARAAHLYEALLWRVGRTVPAGEPILVAPAWPGIYVLLGRAAPVWDILPTWPGVGGLDEEMLRELRAHRVRWALLAMYPVPPSEGEPFDEDYPATYRYLMTEFERLPTPDLPRRVWLLRKREPAVSFRERNASDRTAGGP